MCKEGARRARGARQDKEMVPALLDMKAGLDAVLNQAFQGAEPFAHALKDAFEHFINQRANRPVRRPPPHAHAHPQVLLARYAQHPGASHFGLFVSRQAVAGWGLL